MSTFAASSMGGGKSSSGIFQHEFVVRCYEAIETHFEDLLNTLKKEQVLNDGIERMKKWDPKTIEQELKKLKEDDPEWEMFAHRTMCQYLKDAYKPPGQKIRVRPPKPGELLKKIAHCIALNKGIDNGDFFGMTNVEKEQLLKKCFRRALRKLCDRSCVIEHMSGGSYASSKSGNVKPSIVSQLLSERSARPSMKPPLKGGSMLSRRSSLLTRPSIARQKSQAPTGGESQKSSYSSKRARSENPSLQSKRDPRARSEKPSLQPSLQPSLRAGMIKSVTPEDSVSQVPSNISSRANTVNGKLTAGMLEMHRQRSTAPAKIVSLGKEGKGFFDMSQTGPSEVMLSRR